MKSFPAPTGGWVSNQNLASPPSGLAGAYVLENVFPTALGGEIRKGSAPYAQLGSGADPVTALFTYNFGNNKKFFGATANTVYDITVIVAALNYTIGTEGGDELVTDTGSFIGQLSTGGLEVIEGTLGGEWIDEQFSTTGGNFLVLVNGTDPMQVYDGTDFYAITGQNVNRLNYDGGTVAFTAGAVVTGATSGASATITKVVGTVASGYLVLGNVTGGPFQDNENLTGGGGAAKANGTSVQLFVGITGISTSSFSSVWAYKNRLFFLERDSLNVWYLPIDQIGGVATLFQMGAEFGLGGKLLFGSTWSLDAGNGLKDTCAFVSDEGEFVIYDGRNPNDAADWVRVGRYQMGKPRGPKSFFRAGGDLVVATDIGLVPLSQALQVDYSILSAKAVSFPIETAWNEAVETRLASWDCIVWPEHQMVVVALPTVNEQPPEMYVVNARTGAWAKFTNWDGTCLEIFNGRLFFGSAEGKVIEAYVTGQDQGETFTATYVPLFDDLGSPASLKLARMARAVMRGSQDVNVQLDVMKDYVIDLPSAPSAAPIPLGSEWGVGEWGESSWGGTATLKVQQSWGSVGTSGYALAPSWQVTSGSIIPLDTEIIRIDMTYEVGDIVT
jgi:hypothetical protein